TPNLSFWVSRGRDPAGPPLRGEREADLAIIGGGVTGLSTALHALLRSPRLRVVLLEAHYVGFGATGRSGGVLGNGTEMGTPPGTEDTVPFVIDVVDRLGIACDLERAPVAQLDPYRYALGLKHAAEGLGAAVHEGCRVRSIDAWRNRTRPSRVTPSSTRGPDRWGARPTRSRSSASREAPATLFIAADTAATASPWGARPVSSWPACSMARSRRPGC